MGTESLSRSRRRITAAVTLMLLGSVDCAGPLDEKPLLRFEDCEQLEDFLAERIVAQSRQTLQNPIGWGFGCQDEALAQAPSAGEGEGEGARSADDAEGSGGSATRGFSDTNTQELGVDEPDLVKTDGEVLYVLSGGMVYVVDAWPPEEASELVALEVPGFATNLVLARDRLLVIANDDQEWGATVLSLWDVSDPSAPALQRKTRVDGSTVDARRVGDEVILVTSSWLNTDVGYRSGFFQDDYRREQIRRFGIKGMFPKLRDQIIGVDEEPREEPASSCTNTYAPADANPYNMLLVHALSMEDETAPIRATGVIADFSNVYASAESVFLAAVEHKDGGYFTPDYAVTRVHKLAAFEGKGAAEYHGTGTFYGAVKDEMSLDEHDGLLRMVITDDAQSTDPMEQKTSLLVIEDTGDALVEIARVDDIGKGEGVQAVRFLGDFAYVVTYPLELGEVWFEDGVPSMPFEDPLFVLDLKDGRKPKLRGELEVKGYSTYIHPLGDDHLLTIGVDTDPDDGAYLGLQLSVFDVSDPDRPSLAHRLKVGDENTGSEALSERHAFTYFESAVADTSGLLALPYVQVDPQSWSRTSGTMLFGVDLDVGVWMLDEVNQDVLYPEGVAPDAWCRTNRRNVFIEDEDAGTYLYAVGSTGVAVASLAEAAEVVGTIQFSGATDCGEFFE